MKLDKLTFKLKDGEITLSPKQARKLYEELDEIFGVPDCIGIPTYPPYPCPPALPFISYPTYSDRSVWTYT